MESLNNQEDTMADKTCQGSFVWHDNMSKDPEASKRFYTELVGWTTRVMDMGEMGSYEMIHAGERGIGGFMKTDPKCEAPASWSVYISVEDIDACCTRVGELGGKVHVPPTEIPEVGRFAVVEDPQGGFFCPYQSQNPEEPEECGESPAYGTFVWNELLTSDPEAAGKFYAGLFGWELESNEMGEMGMYHMFKRGEEYAGGMMKMPEGQPMPYWLPYIHVESVDDSTRKAAGLGARVLVEPTDIPGIGRFSVLLDPVGAVVALFMGPAQ
jgi:predicted enzyme related to lactoylglutathione lyase